MKRKVRATGVICVFLLLLALGLTGRTGALPEQRENPSPTVNQRPAAQQRIPVGKPFQPLIDGAKNPELISDRVALRMFFQRIALPPNPTDAELQRLRERVAPMELGEADFQILAEILGRFHGRLAEQRTRLESQRQIARNTALPANFRSYLDEHAQIGTLAVGAYDEAIRTLSPSGVAKLRQHVGRVKTKIKVFPSPDMSTPHH